MKNFSKKLIIFAFVFMAGLFSVKAEGNVAKIGDTEYASLNAAVNSIQLDNSETTEITILRDFEESGFKVPSTKKFTIDFAGHTYTLANAPLVGSTGTETNNFQFLKGSTIEFKNGKIVTKSNMNAGILFQNYSNLTLRDMTIDASASSRSGFYVMSNNNGTSYILGNTSIKSNYYAFDVCWAPQRYPDGAKVVVDTTGIIEGTIQLDTWGSPVDAVKSNLVIKNINHKGSFEAEEYLKKVVSINGGKFTADVNEYVVDNYAWNANTGIVGPYEKTSIPEVNTNNEVKEVTAGATDPTETKNVLDTALKNSDIDPKIKTKMVLNIVNNISAPNDTKAKVSDLLKQKLNNGKVVSYFDASVLALDVKNGNVLREFKELPSAIKLTVLLPKSIQKAVNGYTRKFYIVRQHGDNVELLDAKLSEDGNSLVFETDKFCNFAIVYEDTLNELPSNPKTFDNIYVYIGFGLISLIGIVLIKKHMFN